jgi:hypothetical protein
VAVVDVGVVRMRVPHRLVAVPVRVRLPRHVVRAMRMLVVRVGVLERLVRVPVLVMLGEVQPEPETHEGGGGEEERRHRFVPEQNAECGADERGEREVGAGACRAQIAHRPHVQHEATP